MNHQFKSKIKAGLLALCFWRKPEPEYIIPLPGYSSAIGKRCVKDMNSETKRQLARICHFLSIYTVDLRERQGTCAFIERLCWMFGLSYQETYNVTTLYRIIANPRSDSYGFDDIPDEIFKQQYERIRRSRILFFTHEVLRLLNEVERNPE